MKLLRRWKTSVFIPLLVFMSSSASAGEQPNLQAPVVVELFTSEGCSSCPAADQILSQLSASRPHSIVALSEHVDYWDYLGWRDAHGSGTFSHRQQQYAQAMRLHGVYTPQVVINGNKEGVGNRRELVEALVKEASSSPCQLLKLNVETKPDRLEVDVKPISSLPRNALISSAITADGITSRVSAGENRGRTLSHNNVVLQLSTQNYAPHLSVPLDLPARSVAQRLVIFVQEPGPGRILAVGIYELNR